MKIFLRIIFLFLLISSLGCRPQMICPAFQSTYILDDSLQFAYFSPLWKLDKETRDAYIKKNYDDSKSQYFASVETYVAKAEVGNRTKFGVVRYEPNWLKTYQMRTAPRHDIIWTEGVSEDQTASIDIGSFVASDFGLDSISGDSVIFATQDSIPAKKYLYGYDPQGQNNVEQEYYNKYFGYLLVAKAALTNEDFPTDSTAVADEFTENDSLQVKKRSFLKRKKKKEVTEDETEPVGDDGFEEDDNEKEDN